MSLVTTQDDLFDNVEAFLEGLELGSAKEVTKAKDLIKKADTYLVILTEEVNFFVPSAFIGYKNQTLADFDTEKHRENEVNDQITKLLGSTPKIDKTMDELFLDFCDEIEINRNDVGLSREYWIIKNL